MAEGTGHTTPLAGIRVIDFTRVLSGPYATMALADLGADVVKIENTASGDDTREWGPPFVHGESTYFLSINRNKRSVTLDLKSEEGAEAARRLIDSADVVVENFRPGVMASLGLDHETMSARNPGVIYASISGYGQDGSERTKPGYDPIIQARSGLMSVTGAAEGGPQRVGIAIADISSSMWLTIGILGALHARHTTGRGQHVDVSLFDAQVSWLTNVAGGWFATGTEPVRHGTGHPSIVPSDVFHAADGPLMIAVGNDRMWRRLAEVLGAEHLGTDPRFGRNADRVRNRTVLHRLIEDLLAARTCLEWVDLMDAAGVPVSRVNTIGQALSDPLLEERGMIVEVEHPTAGTIRSLNCPIRFSHARLAEHVAPPQLGQHTDEVLDPVLQPGR